MKYRQIGLTKEKVSALGFGCMRLPTLDRKPSSEEIDEKETVRMLRYAIDNGVNYIDTAYTYLSLIHILQEPILSLPPGVNICLL